MTLGVALVDREHQSLDSAWGATITQTIRIDDTVPDGTLIFVDGRVVQPPVSFVPGGASYFKKAAHKLLPPVCDDYCG